MTLFVQEMKKERIMNLKDSDNKLIKLDALYGYKTMLEWHRNNLEKYLIYQGIYDIYPEISDEESRTICEFCYQNATENTNILELSHYITDQYYKGNISLKDIEKFIENDIFYHLDFEKINCYFPTNNDENSNDRDMEFSELL